LSILFPNQQHQSNVKKYHIHNGTRSVSPYNLIILHARQTVSSIFSTADKGSHHIGLLPQSR